MQLGALAAGNRNETIRNALEHYGYCIGLAFQIRDDILDVEGDTAVIGKRQGADQARDKPTYPALLGIKESRLRLQQLTDQALAAIAPLGNAAKHLHDLARFVADRPS